MNTRWEAANLATLGGAGTLGCLGAGALFGLVLAVLGAVRARQDEGPTAQWFLGIGILVFISFGAATWLVRRRSRTRIRVGWDDDAVLIEIDSAASGRTTLRGPFTIERGWVRDRIATGHGTVANVIVMLAVFDAKRRPVLYLREQLGAIFQAPAGFPERVVQLTGPCPHVYTNTIGRLDLGGLASALERT